MDEFSKIADEYWEKTKANPKLNFDMKLAAKDEDYLKAQRFLIRSTISPHAFKNFDDYAQSLDKIQHRPVEDSEWIENFVTEMDELMASTILGHKPKQKSKDFVVSKLEEYRTISNELQKYDGRDVCEYKKGNITVILD